MSAERMLWDNDATGLAELVHKGEIVSCFDVIRIDRQHFAERGLCKVELVLSVGDQPNQQLRGIPAPRIERALR